VPSKPVALACVRRLFLIVTAPNGILPHTNRSTKSLGIYSPAPGSGNGVGCLWHTLYASTHARPLYGVGLSVQCSLVPTHQTRVFPHQSLNHVIASVHCKELHGKQCLTPVRPWCPAQRQSDEGERGVCWQSDRGMFRNKKETTTSVGTYVFSLFLRYKMY